MAENDISRIKVKFFFFCFYINQRGALGGACGVSFNAAPVRTGRPLPGQRAARPADVLSRHLEVVGGPGLQVVQSVGGHVTNEEVHGLVSAWKDNNVQNSVRKSEHQGGELRLVSHSQNRPNSRSTYWLVSQKPSIKHRNELWIKSKHICLGRRLLTTVESLVHRLNADCDTIQLLVGGDVRPVGPVGGL